MKMLDKKEIKKLEKQLDKIRTVLSEHAAHNPTCDYWLYAACNRIYQAQTNIKHVLNEF
tara:strand:- start:382 stop:558 length:177 start_codon:yes stop_codon:yes gene_type:complete